MNGTNEQEPLEELFGTVFDLAGEIASRISPGEIEAKLRRTLLAAGRHPGGTPAGEPAGRSREGKVPDDAPSVSALVARASGGDQDAWNEIVNRYGPMVYAICIRYRLSRYDIEDVGQNVWLRLVGHLDRLRDPAALPGWLATTTRRECLRVLTVARKSERPGSTSLDDSVVFADDTAIDEEILTAERNAALRAACAGLPQRSQQFLSMLISDPPYSYAEISATLGIPVGSIGPMRARCLEQLRRSGA